ncbi:hypothetical protein Avbf_15960, partial [Armadillidium vulgare]
MVEGPTRNNSAKLLEKSNKLEQDIQYRFPFDNRILRVMSIVSTITEMPTKIWPRSDYFFLTKKSPSFDESGPIIKTFNRLCPGRNWREGLFYYLASNSPDPRLLKHHIPYTFLNPAMLKKGK